MDLAAAEQRLRANGVLVVDPRVLRRVVKAHCKISGLQVPHAHCYGLAADDLYALASELDLGAPRSDFASFVILLARPSPRERAGRSDREVLTRLWRTVVHGRIHRELEERFASGELTDGDLRRRIDVLGQTEFDEVRAILRHDDCVLPPGGDREVFIEFAALYLELRHFAPGLLVTNFPSLAPFERIDQVLAQDLDIVALIEAGRPEGVALEPRTLKQTSGQATSATFGMIERGTAKAVSPAKHASLMSKADKASSKGNDVRAILLRARAANIADDSLRHAAEEAVRADLRRFQGRLGAALSPLAPVKNDAQPEWSSLLRMVANEAASRRSVGYSVEARLLYALQKAVHAHEHVAKTVDVVGWALSLGKLGIVRALPATQGLRVLRYIRDAAGKVRQLRIEDADRRMLRAVLDWAEGRAEHNARAALTPRIVVVLDQVGMAVRTMTERLARDKLAAELIDRIMARGFVDLGSLRDALSRNQLKLGDLNGPGEFFRGDPLLRADEEFNIVLDGVYRRGEIYLRWLQKLSSLPFGTDVGRAITLFVLLPLGGAFILLEAIKHMVSPITKFVGLGPVDPMSLSTFLFTALILLALIHSKPFRKSARQLLDLIVAIIVFTFFRLPRFVLARPFVKRLFARREVRIALRGVLAPLLLSGAICFLSPIRDLGLLIFSVSLVGIFVVTSAVMTSKVGGIVEEFVVEQLAPAWWTVSRQVLPGVFRAISRFFTRVMDLIQRGMYRIDELFRFGRGQNPLVVAVKALLGPIWFFIAYVVRLYVVLLIEPEVNPLKHFPVVTVSHKLIIPFAGDMLDFCTDLLAPLGSVVGGTIAGITVFLAPSVFGFLAWELKENWKLYTATRHESLTAVSIGPHGETMRGLLIAGIHSGTLPKLYGRLRRAAQREDEVTSSPLARKGVRTNEGSLGRFRDGIREIERGLLRFIKRELVALLNSAPSWPHGEVCVDRIDVSSNRVRARISCAQLSATPLELTFEEQSGFIVAGISTPGWLTQLQIGSVGHTLFENALAGVYQLSEVDLVREVIAYELGDDVNYDIADEGLIVWPGNDYRTELVYSLTIGGKHGLLPKVRGDVPQRDPIPLDPRHLLFREQAIPWVSWVAVWTAAELQVARVPRVLRGVSILPTPYAPALPALEG